MKRNTLLWIAGTGIGVMAVIAALMASQPKPQSDGAVATAALMTGSVGGVETRRTLWCGLALRIAVAEAPAENQDKDLVRRYAEGAETLIAAAGEAYLAAGYGEAAFEAHLKSRVTEVTAEINATDDSTEFSFEECSALIGL